MMLKCERLVVSLSAARCCTKALPALASVSAEEPEREKTPTEARRPGRLSETTETPLGSFVIWVVMGVDGTPTRGGTPGKGSSIGTEIGEMPWKIFQREGATGASLFTAATAWEEEDKPLRERWDRRASMLVGAKRWARLDWKQTNALLLKEHGGEDQEMNDELHRQTEWRQQQQMDTGEEEEEKLHKQ
jgi:hypothetical protein